MMGVLSNMLNPAESRIRAPWTPPSRDRYRLRLIRRADRSLASVLLRICEAQPHRNSLFGSPDNSRLGRCIVCGLAVPSNWDVPLPDWLTPRVDRVSGIELEAFLREVMAEQEQRFTVEFQPGGGYLAAWDPGDPEGDRSVVVRAPE